MKFLLKKKNKLLSNSYFFQYWKKLMKILSIYLLDYSFRIVSLSINLSNEIY